MTNFTQISDLLVEIERPKSPKRKKKMQRNLSIEEYEGKTYLGDRLYNNHKKGLDKTYEREKQKIENEIANMQTFKVENKHTIFLNSRRDIKPIQDRTQDILRDREVAREKKRAEYEREKKRKRM